MAGSFAVNLLTLSYPRASMWAVSVCAVCVCACVRVCGCVAMVVVARLCVLCCSQAHPVACTSTLNTRWPPTLLLTRNA